ncbi:MAG: AI-2E family transporter [Verrucomicrobiales bacterium]|nr:AI-2E family transporter [Verrucomicrobiales bacterium]MCP5560521.1 AI-2E family transporter [Verrucomicrobiaceae bacterium]
MKDAATKHIRSIAIAAHLVTATCILGLLYYGRPVLMPLALAVLIAFALHPAVRRLIRLGLPRPLSVAITVGAFALVLTGLSWFIGGQVSAFALDLPKYRDNIGEKVHEAKSTFSGGLFDKVRDTVASASTEIGGSSERAAAPADAPWTATEWLASVGAVTDPLTTFGLVALLAVMLLLQWSELRARLLGLLSGSVSHTTQALADAAQRVGKYLALQFVYNTSFGIVAATGLWLIGVPYAPLWGLCAAILRYVPYIGPAIAAALPVLVSLVTSSGWSQVGAVAALFLVLEVISNNFIEPWLYGSRLGVSEIAIVLASVGWTYLWGAPGLVLATPLTVCLVVLGTHVPCLAFIARILGTEKVFTDPQAIYQRLLAGDGHEAAELAQDHMEEMGASTFKSDILLPALALARRDQAAAWLTPDGTQQLLEGIDGLCREMIEIEADEDPPDSTSPETREKPAKPVIFWSACPFLDASMPLLKNDLMLTDGPPTYVYHRDLVGSVLEQSPPVAVVIAALSSVDTHRITLLVKRIRRAWPNTPIAAALLGGIYPSAEEKNEAVSVGASTFVTTLAEVRVLLATYAANNRKKPVEAAA